MKWILTFYFNVHNELVDMDVKAMFDNYSNSITIHTFKANILPANKLHDVHSSIIYAFNKANTTPVNRSFWFELWNNQLKKKIYHPAAKWNTKCLVKLLSILFWLGLNV